MSMSDVSVVLAYSQWAWRWGWAKLPGYLAALRRERTAAGKWTARPSDNLCSAC